MEFSEAPSDRLTRSGTLPPNFLRNSMV